MLIRIILYSFTVVHIIFGNVCDGFKHICYSISDSDSGISVCASFMHSQGTVLTPTMDHAMSIQPTSMMGPLTQQLSHLSLGSTGTVSTKHTRIHTCNAQRQKIVPKANCSEIHKVKYSCQILSAFPTVYSGQHDYAGDLHPPVHPSASLQCPRGMKLASNLTAYI